MNFNALLMKAYKNGGLSKTAESDSRPTEEKKTNFQINNTSIINPIEKVSSKERYAGDVGVSEAAKALTSGGLIKVPALPRESDGRESVYRRVAKFLLLIGVDEAAKILPHLSDEQTEKIIPEIATIQKIDPDEAEQILSEFQSLFYKVRESGGIDTAKEILEKAFGSDKAKQILDSVDRRPAGKPFDYLSESDGDKVSVLLKDESNAVRALVLSYLKPKVSADVIKSFSAEDKRDVVIRLANLKKINPDVLRRVDEAMYEKANKLSVQKSDAIDGRSALAQILKRMDPGTEEEILSSLSEQDHELGDDLRSRLFTTEDVVMADDRFIQDYLRKMGDNDISYLIAAKNDDFRRKILRNVSQSRGNGILELEVINKPMPRSEVDKITAKFMEDMKMAYDNGDLIVSGRNGELYV